MANYQPNQETVETKSVSTGELINDLMEETTAVNYVEVIENVIRSLEQEHSAMVNQASEHDYLWKFNYGSVEVFVRLTGNTDEGRLTVWSVVLHLPVKDEPKLTRKLLEMNCSSTFESRFGIIENQVVVIAISSLAELSPATVSRLITVVATIADNNDEALQSEFSAA